jgi:hypothetical protein
MTRCFTVILAFVLLTACGTTQSATPTLPPQLVNTLEPHSMKGYELYSWQSEGVWHFSVLIGTNRMKTIAEITDVTTRVTGVPALKDQLKQLAAGEYVTWSTLQGDPALALPPDAIIADIRAYCEQLGLQFSVVTP